ncbi:MAG: cobyric acid synthase [Erysipelotrichales bacterium]
MPKYIMVQGCTSNAGKTTLCAAICRILKEDGYKVAPFKAQNMGLNSYIDSEGRELGFGQALQAFACGIEPKAWMNPILLKPIGDGEINLILNGEYEMTLKGSEFGNQKQEYLDKAISILEENTKDYDIVVLEGAGSPAEINMVKPDIANMGLATALNANVILVGNIELGGVFASLYGTYSLLEKNERELISGFIINKLHGYANLLDSGINIMEEKMNIQSLGVLPFMELDLEDEDMTTFNKIEQDALLKIAILKSPYATNLNMFKQLTYYRNVSVVLVDKDKCLDGYDAIIIPMSANFKRDSEFFEKFNQYENKIYSANGDYIAKNIYTNNIVEELKKKNGFNDEDINLETKVEELRERELDRLATNVRDNLDMDILYKTIKIEK